MPEVVVGGLRVRKYGLDLRHDILEGRVTDSVPIGVDQFVRIDHIVNRVDERYQDFAEPVGTRDIAARRVLCRAVLLCT